MVDMLVGRLVDKLIGRQVGWLLGLLATIMKLEEIVHGGTGHTSHSPSLDIEAPDEDVCSHSH